MGARPEVVVVVLGSGEKQKKGGGGGGGFDRLITAGGKTQNWVCGMFFEKTKPGRHFLIQSHKKQEATEEL